MAARISDPGIANLRFCNRLEDVNLMGSPTGDSAIEAFQGKAKLRRFSTGRHVTDAGLSLLHNFPLLQTCNGRHENRPPSDRRPVHKCRAGCPRGSRRCFRSRSVLARNWHHDEQDSRILPPAQSCGSCRDGELSDDEAMRHFAAIPRLRKLRAQETVATDDGFEALAGRRPSRASGGRDCPNFGSRGFVAFSHMPSLRSSDRMCQRG